MDDSIVVGGPPQPSQVRVSPIHMLKASKKYYGEELPPFVVHTSNVKSRFVQGKRWIKPRLHALKHLFGAHVEEDHVAEEVIMQPWGKKGGKYGFWTLDIGKLRIIVKGKENHAWLGPEEEWSHISIAESLPLVVLPPSPIRSLIVKLKVTMPLGRSCMSFMSLQASR